MSPRINFRSIDLTLLSPDCSFLRRCAAGLWLCLLLTCARAQPYVVQYGLRSGLPSQWVYQAVVDAEGFVWLATRSGVARFDGYGFTNYSTADGLADNDVFRIIPDATGRLWFNTLGHLTYREGESFHPAPFEADLQGKELRWIQPFGKGIVMAVGNPARQHWEFLHYDMKGTGEVETLAISAAGRPVAQIPNRYLMVLDSAEIWASSTDFHYSVSGGLRDSIARPFPRTAGNSGFPSVRHGELFFTDAGIAAFDGDSVQLRISSLPDGRPIRDGWCIFEDRRQRLWIGSQSTGLVRLRLEGDQVREVQGFPDVNGRISSIAEDREGNMYVTTLGKGLFFIPKYADYIHALSPAGHSENPGFQSLLVTAEGDLLAGSNDNRLLHLSDEKWQSHALAGSPSERLTAMVSLDSDKVLAGGAALTVVDLKTGRQQHFADACIKDMHRVAESVHVATCSRELILPVAELRDGSLPGGQHLDAYARDVGRANAVWFDAARNLRWRGDFHGLHAFRGSDREPVSMPGTDILEGISVLDIWQDSRQHLWVATDGNGLIVLDPETGRHWRLDRSGPERQRLGASSCRQICPDGQGNVWLATDRGLDRIQNFDFAAGTWQVRHLDETHGLATRDINALAPHPDGSLYVATDQGLMRLAPGLLQALDAAKPRAYIAGLDVNGAAVPTSGELRFAHTENDISIHFGGQSYASQGQLRYAIRMEGLEAATDTVTFRQANYRNLQPGRYAFQVHARDHNGNWSAAAAEIHFTIAPHFAQTFWFRGIILLLVLGLAGVLVLRRTRRIRQRAALNLRMLELERAALRAQMNPHFISNVLGSVQHYILKQDGDRLLAADYLADFSQLIRMMLDHARTPWVRLEEEIRFLSLYLSLEQIRLPDKLRYEIEVDPALDSARQLLPAMLVQPYVENAIQHGIRHLDGDGLVRVQMRAAGSGLEIVVEDNGIGREAARALQDPERMHRSHGTRIGQERVAALNASGKASIRIVTADGHPGTIVTLYIDEIHATDTDH